MSADVHPNPNWTWNTPHWVDLSASFIFKKMLALIDLNRNENVETEIGLSVIKLWSVMQLLKKKKWSISMPIDL